jgi:flagella basal body P-ring formation protein FlgA
MTSFARTALVLAVWFSPLMGAAPSVAEPPDPTAHTSPAGALSELLTEQIARRWQIAPEAVQLIWHQAQQAALAEHPSLVRILGQGADGWHAVVCETSDGEEFAVSVRAGYCDTVLVAKRDLSTGTRIAPGDLTVEEKFRWGPPKRDPRDRPQAGWEVRRPVAAGEIASWPAVVAPSLINAGEPVCLLWTRGTVKISMQGTALNAARHGESVRVRVPRRIGPLVGVAEGPGRVVLSVGGGS